jgi:hypothetical protein
MRRRRYGPRMVKRARLQRRSRARMQASRVARRPSRERERSSHRFGPAGPSPSVARCSRHQRGGRQSRWSAVEARDNTRAGLSRRLPAGSAAPGRRGGSRADRRCSGGACAGPPRAATDLSVAQAVEAEREDLPRDRDLGRLAAAALGDPLKRLAQRTAAAARRAGGLRALSGARRALVRDVPKPDALVGAADGRGHPGPGAGVLGERVTSPTSAHPHRDVAGRRGGSSRAPRRIAFHQMLDARSV